VEAIALILLNRHPLSAIAPLVQTAPDKKTANEVNLIDLPPGHQYPAMRDWLAKEHKAFKHAISWSEESQLNVAEIATTLVVTPLPLLKQWISELATHAPSLRVCVYPGWSFLIQQVRTKRKAEVKAHEKREANKLKRKNTKFRNQTRAKYAKGSKGKVAVEQEDESESEDDSEDEADEVPEDSLDSLLQATQRYWLDYVRSHDVVISIYQTLGDDLKVAHPAPQRSRRSTAKYNLEERPRSPLVMVEWFRVIMDEVQLQGDQSDAANMVSLLPRKNSLAMSGTPARNDVRDLIGSIRFLRVPGVDRTFWNRLLHPDNRPSLHSLFQTLAIRTTKAQVAHEFSLPAQQRFIIPIELSEIEHHYYQDTLERQRERLRIFQDPSVFRTSLRNLRQICTHIQVGALDYAGPQVMERRDRIQLGRQLMTMEEALQKMRADHEATLVDNIKKQMRTMLRKAELIVLDDLDDLRSHKALTLYSRVRDHGQKIIDPARIQLASLMTDREESVELDVDKNASQFERERIKKILTTTSL
jgi:E3 ubiquitin-protein ligase SHPRH